MWDKIEGGFKQGEMVTYVAKQGTGKSVWDEFPPNLAYTTEDIANNTGFELGELSLFAAYHQREYKSDITTYVQIQEWVKENDKQTRID